MICGRTHTFKEKTQLQTDRVQFIHFSSNLINSTFGITRILRCTHHSLVLSSRSTCFNALFYHFPLTKSNSAATDLPSASRQHGPPWGHLRSTCSALVFGYTPSQGSQPLIMLPLSLHLNSFCPVWIFQMALVAKPQVSPPWKAFHLHPAGTGPSWAPPWPLPASKSESQLFRTHPAALTP